MQHQRQGERSDGIRQHCQPQSASRDLPHALHACSEVRQTLVVHVSVSYLSNYINKGHAASWPTSRYNRLNGTHLSENKILKEVLRDEWKFDGMVMSDWYINR